MRHLLVHGEEDQDVAEIADRFSEYSLQVALRFLHAVRKAYEALLHMPGMGAIRDFPNPNYAGVRSWPVKGYRNILKLLPANGGWNRGLASAAWCKRRGEAIQLNVAACENWAVNETGVLNGGAHASQARESARAGSKPTI